MKIALISPYSDISALGIRWLSATLKTRGHNVRKVFIPEVRPEISGMGDTWGTLSEDIIRGVITLVQDCDLIGISLMSNYFLRAIRLSEGLKKELPTDIPIIWGGIHPTIQPEESLAFADGVCLGEGEDALVELVDIMEQGGDWHSTANFWFNTDGSITRNPVRPLERDLDRLPFPDYDLDDDHVFDEQRLCFLPMDRMLLKKHLDLGYISGIRGQTAYQTIATRGCPHNCSYCCNNKLREFHGAKGYLRRRSVTHLITELGEITKRYEFIQEIGLSDDSFFAATLDEIRHFAEQYRELVKLPFFCLGSPTTITADKLEILVDAGMYGMQMGIQTGSEKTLKLYRRHIRSEQVIAAARLLNRFKNRMIPPTYDIIIDNPYETAADYAATFALLLRLPKPHRIQIFSLVLFPGTELYQRALKDNLTEKVSAVTPIKEYHHRRGTYVNLVFALFARNMPPPLLRLMAWPPLVCLLSMQPFRLFFESAYRVFHALRHTRSVGPKR